MCMKILSNYNISTGLGDKLYSSNSVVALNPKTSHILPLGRKLISGSCLQISMTEPRILCFDCKWIIRFCEFFFHR